MRECIQSRVVQNELETPQDASKCIANLAETLSYNKNHESPWTVAAVKEGRPREREMGGKEDDITVIVAQIKMH